MTIRKQWLTALILVAILSVIVNVFVFSSLLDKYFVRHMEESYSQHFNQILDYSKKALLTKDFSLNQMAIELESHLTDPIVRIKLYDGDGQLLIDVSNNNYFHNNMNHGMMRRMKDFQFEEVDHADLYEEDNLIGQLNITRYSSVENSLAVRMFKSSLLRNSVISIGIVIIFTTLIGLFVSKKMSKDLIQTTNLAHSIELGKQIDISHSKVKEIRTIQLTLETLKSKLKLKQKSRKKLIDEMIHQTRTPLTILKTYLEGYEDGIIDLSKEQLKICEYQINNVTAIISNISEMIDTEQEVTANNVSEFELHELLKQIVRGLKIQFDKKKINLSILNQQKVFLKTDKYKLSQAIYNILTNAYKFTKPNGSVVVNYGVKNEHLALTIEDSGVGINSKDVNKIFNAYYSGKNTDESIGEGIGLYISQENIKSINGVIEIDSTVGVGSKFTINIPLFYE